MENYGYYRPNQQINRFNQRKRSTLVNLIITLVITLIIGGLTTSCVSTKKYNAAVQEKEAAETQLAKMKVDKTFDENDQATALYEKQNTIYGQNKDIIAKAQRLDSLEGILSDQKQSLQKVNTLVTKLSKQDWYIDEVNGRLKLDISSNLIFPINSAELTNDGAKLIDELAISIKSLDDKVMVRIVGHTDNQPFDNARYDNWDLSADRSIAVVRALEKKGLDPKMISATARSQYEPKATNDTEKGRMMNRRVEVQLIPVDLMNETIAELLKKKS